MNKTIALIPHYNNFSGLVKTILSIDVDEKVDILIIDDGSSKDQIDESILKSKCFFKGSIFIQYLKKNSGIEMALNCGLETITKLNRYEYIARIDCGDCCIGKRFAIQENFLESNSTIALVGSNAIAVDLDGNELYKTIFPEKHQDIKNKMYLNAMFLHPCIMFRSKILSKIGFYPTEFTAAEDYAFFFTIINKFESYNIQQFLVQYEINNKGISITKRTQQVKSRIKIIRKHYYFSFWPTYGLLRNIGLLIIPNSFIHFIKKLK